MATAKPQLPGRLNEIKSDPADQEEWTSVALVLTIWFGNVIFWRLIHQKKSSKFPSEDSDLGTTRFFFWYLNINGFFDFHGLAYIAGLGQVQGSSDLQDRKHGFLESKVAVVEVVEDFGKHFGGQNVTYIYNHIHVTHVGMNYGGIWWPVVT